MSSFGAWAEFPSYDRRASDLLTSPRPTKIRQSAFPDAQLPRSITSWTALAMSGAFFSPVPRESATHAVDAVVRAREVTSASVLKLAALSTSFMYMSQLTSSNFVSVTYGFGTAVLIVEPAAMVTFWNLAPTFQRLPIVVFESTGREVFVDPKAVSSPRSRASSAPAVTCRLRVVTTPPSRLLGRKARDARPSAERQSRSSRSARRLGQRRS